MGPVTAQIEAAEKLRRIFQRLGHRGSIDESSQRVHGMGHDGTLPYKHSTHKGNLVTQLKYASIIGGGDPRHHSCEDQMASHKRSSFGQLAIFVAP